jgi:DNA-binding response OmpR family regulator
MSKSVLVVDDEERLVQLVQTYLEQEGYRVLTAHDGRRALAVARKEKPDLILLDVMMPEMNGYEFLRRHRQERNTPVILLTARVEETDKVLGLELGADDYITKPFSPRELVARVRAALRRAGISVPEGEVLRAWDIVLDRAGHRVTVGDRPVDLTPTEFDLLATLLSAPGRVFSRLELLDRVLGTSFEGYERTIDVHVKNLRSKIESEPSRPGYIETVYGVGYRLAAEEGQ